MNAVHAGNALHLPRHGECARMWPQSHGVYLFCGEPALLLGELCDTHLIEWAAEQPAAYWIAHDRMTGARR